MFRRVPAVSRTGFTLLEALVCLTILGLASASIFLAVESSVVTSQDVVEETIANGLAVTMLDEISGLPYVEKGTVPQEDMGPEETSPSNRLAWDDLDDYHGLVMRPVVDRYGLEIGSGGELGNERPLSFRIPEDFFDDWRLSVTVQYVNEVHAPKNGVENYRRVEVVVEKYAPSDNSLVPWKLLSRVERTYGYVPPVQ